MKINKNIANASTYYEKYNKKYIDIDIDECKYSGYSIGFDRHGFFFHPSGGNVIIFGVGMSSSTSCLFVNGGEVYKTKAKDSGIVATPLCLGNISNNWAEDDKRNWIKWMRL